MSQRKAGFSGTLDPLASGLLIIFLNKATKLCSSFLNADKSYKATIKLGITSTTGDITGEIISSSKIPDIRDIDLKKIEENGKTTVGQAADSDTLVASANAYISSLNKMIIKRDKTATEQQQNYETQKMKGI